jgi:uncharacterized protein
MRGRKKLVMNGGRGAEPISAEDCFVFGMRHSSGAGVPADFIQAHIWFNIAAARGHRDASRMRQEIAALMRDGDIRQAQRAALAWLLTQQIPAVDCSV